MKQKFEVAKVLLKFKRQLENHSKIQMVEFDNGNECTSQRFNSFNENLG